MPAASITDRGSALVRDEQVDDPWPAERRGGSQRALGRRLGVGELNVRAGLKQRPHDVGVAVACGAVQRRAVLGFVILVGTGLHEDARQRPGPSVAGIAVEASHADVGQRRGWLNVGRGDKSGHQRGVVAEQIAQRVAIAGVDRLANVVRTHAGKLPASASVCPRNRPRCSNAWANVSVVRSPATSTVRTHDLLRVDRTSRSHASMNHLQTGDISIETSSVVSLESGLNPDRRRRSSRLPARKRPANADLFASG